MPFMISILGILKIYFEDVAVSKVQGVPIKNLLEKICLLAWLLTKL